MTQTYINHQENVKMDHHCMAQRSHSIHTNPAGSQSQDIPLNYSLVPARMTCPPDPKATKESPV